MNFNSQEIYFKMYFKTLVHLNVTPHELPKKMPFMNYQKAENSSGKQQRECERQQVC